MKKSATKTAHATKTATLEASGQATAAATSTALAPATAPPATPDPTAASSNAIVLQLQALEQAGSFGDPLPNAVRKANEKLVQRVPATIVDRILALAVRSGGTVAGITLDPAAAKAALAEADDADAVAAAAQMLVRRAQDKAISLRAGVTGQASAIRTAMRGYAKTAQGASLKQENDAILTLAKQAAAARKARKTRAENAAEAATTPEPVEAATPSPAPAAAASAPKAS